MLVALSVKNFKSIREAHVALRAVHLFHRPQRRRQEQPVRRHPLPELAGRAEHLRRGHRGTSHERRRLLAPRPGVRPGPEPQDRAVGGHGGASGSRRRLRGIGKAEHDASDLHGGAPVRTGIRPAAGGARETDPRQARGLEELHRVPLLQGLQGRRSPREGVGAGRSSPPGRTGSSSHGDGGSRGRPAPVGRSPLTVVGGTNTSDYPTVLAAKREMASWRILHLEPSAMRTPDTRSAPTHVSASGGHIPATLHALVRRDPNASAEILNRLRQLNSDVGELGRLRRRRP